MRINLSKALILKGSSKAYETKVRVELAPPSD